MPPTAKRASIQRVIGAIIMITASLGSLGMALSLFTWGRFTAATPWLVLTVFFLFITALVFFGRSTTGTGVSGSRVEMVRYNDEYVVVLSTSDPILLTALRHLLEANGIESRVLGEHSTEMLRFVAGIEVRVLVRRQDAQRSSELLAEIVRVDDDQGDHDGR